MKPSLDNEGEITATINKLESHRTTSLRPLQFNLNVTRNELEQTIEGIVSKNGRKKKIKWDNYYRPFKTLKTMKISLRTIRKRDPWIPHRGLNQGLDHQVVRPSESGSVHL